MFRSFCGFRGAWLIIATCACWPSMGTATTRRVPSEYPTIQAGIDASAAGDTVLVAPGTYTDFEVRGTRTACVFLKAGVVLRSEAGATFTTIDMQGMGTLQPNVVFGVLLGLPGTTVEGFTITGVPVGRSGVLLAESEKVVFRDCAFVDLDGGDGGGAGGLVARFTDIDLLECSFENCRTTDSAGGIGQRSARLFVSGCAFVECPHAIFVVTETAVGELWVENSSFVRNKSASGTGGAIQSSQYSAGCRITGCYFEENEAGSAGAIIASGDGLVTIENCVFWNNRTAPFGEGGAILIAGGGVVTGNTFFENQGGHPLSSGAIMFYEGSSQLENNVIAGTSGGVGVGTLAGAGITGGCNVFWNNTDGNAIGYVLDETDREVDPLFCDVDAGDFSVAEKSPCLPANSQGCGLIGALGAGCGMVSVEATTWGRIKSSYRGERNDAEE